MQVEGDPVGKALNGELSRPPEADVRRVVEAWLDEHVPGYPTYTLVEDGEDGWAFWIVPQDTTSYVDPDGRIQWLGTGWPENYSYDGETGRWLEVGVGDTPHV